MSLFTSVVAKIPRRNSFNLSHEHHTSVDFGMLVPVFCQEAIPGDKFRAHTESVVKLQPMLAPVMSRIDVYFHYFFVPNRLLYTGWEDFITSGQQGDVPNGTLSTPVAPCFDFTEMMRQGYLERRKLADYFGLPVFARSDADGDYSDVPPISALPFLAYHKIFSDWFRDELLDPTEFEPVDDGMIPNLRYIKYLTVRNRSWRKDYFTSARPDTQLGAAVQVPVSGDIVGTGNLRVGSNSSAVVGNARGLFVGNSSSVEDLQDLDPRYVNTIHAVGAGLSPEPGNALMYGDGLSLEDAGVFINDLRRALRLQEWQEKNMRGGNRYIESIYHHFGVKSSDARLQRSRFLGGRKIPVLVGEVNSTVDTTDDSAYTTGLPQGNRSGLGNSVGRTQTIKFFAEEHGFFICLMSILPRASYQQGIERMFANRWDRFEYAWPEFGNLGEQEVRNYELYVHGDNKNGNVFGYQSRYAEYKFSNNRISGDFRDTLSYWHNGRIFRNRPALNSTFLYLDGQTSDANGQNRIFAVPSSDYGQHFLAHMYHDIRVLRMLPKYGIPSI